MRKLDRNGRCHAIVADERALIRIAGFVTLGVVLAGPVLSRLFGFEYRLRDQRRWIALAGVALLTDVALKWVLAPSWREMIRNAAGW